MGRPHVNAMRLRLQISRHTLPDTRLLWQAKSNHTVAQFLSHLNIRYPLETAEWGLEDYIVSVAGYEALHYHRICDVFQPDDEVCIRPLETNEVKQRRLLGREQIAANGMHLFDGLPFGRHNNTSLILTRPPIRIPPRNLIGVDLDEDQFLDDIENGGEVDEDEEQLAITAGGEDFDDEDDEEDESYHDGSDVEMSDEADIHDVEADEEKQLDTLHPSSECVNNEEQEAPWNGCSPSSGTPVGKTRPSLKDVTFREQDALENQVSPSSDMPVAEISKPAAKHEDSVSSSSSSSESSNDAETASSSSAEESNHSDDTSSESESSSDDSSSDSDSDSGDEPKLKSSKQIPAKIPFNGTKQTQERNKRRAIHKKMLWLKEQGCIPQDASHEDAKVWMASNESPGSNRVSATTTKDQSADGRKQVIKPTASAASANKMTDTTSTNGQDTDLAFTLAQKRKELLDQIESGGIDVSASSASPASETVDTAATSQQSTPAAKRARIDVTSSQRLLLGALGVKAPKSAAERQKIQDKLAQQAKRKPVEQPVSKLADQAVEKSVLEPSEVRDNTGTVSRDDPDFWRSKLVLSAVECCPEARVQTLCEPPFPFCQRWDPALTRGKKRKRTQVSGSNKRTQLDEDGSYAYMYDEIDYDEYDATMQNDADAAYDEVYTLAAAEGAAAETEHDQESARALPELPSDITRLPLVFSASDLEVGDLITYAVLEASAQTNWAPAISPVRTASVEMVTEKRDHTLYVSLLVAERDMPVRQYVEGKRVYDRFEMPDDDAGQGEEGSRCKSYSFGELVQPRVLMRRAALEKWKEEHGGGTGGRADVQDDGDDNVDDAVDGRPINAK